MCEIKAWALSNRAGLYHNQQARGEWRKWNTIDHCMPMWTQMKAEINFPHFYFPTFDTQTSSICSIKASLLPGNFSHSETKCHPSMRYLWAWRGTKRAENGIKKTAILESININRSLKNAIHGAEMIQHSGSSRGRPRWEYGTNNHILQGIQVLGEVFKEIS